MASSLPSRAGDRQVGYTPSIHHPSSFLDWSGAESRHSYTVILLLFLKLYSTWSNSLAHSLSVTTSQPSHLQDITRNRQQQDRPTALHLVEWQSRVLSYKSIPGANSGRQSCSPSSPAQSDAEQAHRQPSIHSEEQEHTATGQLSILV